MATIAFSLAGQFAGGLLGGPIGATIGRALGALAGSAVDNVLFGGAGQETTPRDIALMGSSEGGAIPRIYGWNRVSGNIIWATELERVTAEGSGAKGLGGSGEDEEIVANFAVALCEGEVAHMGRIWADGQVLETEGLNIRFYPGSENQQPDALIVAKQEPGTAPAYRGTCYIVFEQLPLSPFGNRIPNISVELCRVVGELEPSIRAVTVIPGSTEFGYDPVPRIRMIGPGETTNENAHLLGQTSDWTLSLDELTALCPNLEHVALVVAWFGTDLRCGECRIEPRVEGTARTVRDAEWRVSGLTRELANPVSMYGGAPAYGGTPSDNAVLAAIADLKARGLKVTLYPIVLMDIPEENALPDSYTGASGQPAYPWRGRITCDPAPGLAGTPDGTVAVDAQVTAFVGQADVADYTAQGETVSYTGVAEWSYRRMVLHYAHLMALAGGVDAFLLGSETRGLTTLRRAAESFPFVEALISLAHDVRAVLGGAAKITYAADWSEYSGYQPADAPGDKIFHLDPLWADADIDAIGIDNYMPLADWREGYEHADATLAQAPHDLAYLGANIAGGEGYDWYYVSDAAREAQARTPISDNAYGEPWVWRYKDLAGWWSNAHHNRVGGVRATNPTAWTPRSKPLWLTEVGCGAVDKGANLPSAFGDPKSSEDTLPWYSSGTPDPLIQRQFLRAHCARWRPDAPGFADADNPVSALYGGRMLDADRIYFWAWDARPYPAFPNQRDVWSDGRNHEAGHWLTGRLGGAATDELIRTMASDFRVPLIEATPALALTGLRADGVSTMRDAAEALISAAGLRVHDRPDGIRVFAHATRPALEITASRLVREGPVINRRRPDASAALARFTMAYAARDGDYAAGTVSATTLDGMSVANTSTNLVLDGATASRAAETMLEMLRVDGDELELRLPPSCLALEVGDVIAVEGQGDGPFEITDIRDGLFRRVTARTIARGNARAVGADRPASTAGKPVSGSAPFVVGAHIPDRSSLSTATRLAIGAYAKPWPGGVSVKETTTGATLTALRAAATIGELVRDLGEGTSGIWDSRAAAEVKLYGGHLSSAGDEAVLAGINRLAVQSDDGSWEILGFAVAELVAPKTYRLSNLLRGLAGTLASGAGAGKLVMLLTPAVSEIEVGSEYHGGTLRAIAYGGTRDPTGTGFAAEIGFGPSLPLAPVHLRAARNPGTGDVTLSWVRRSRINGNSWTGIDVPLDFAPETYLVTILDGGVAVRSVSVAAPQHLYAAAEQVSDFGELPTAFTFTIAQAGAAAGIGHISTGMFNG